MIPFASGSMEKGKSLLSPGSTDNLNSQSSIKDNMMNSDKKVADKEQISQLISKRFKFH
jgi:acid phosphatase class B